MILTYLRLWNNVKIVKLLHLEQGYNHTKFERRPLNSVRQKANIKVFVKSENTSLIN